ncbi:MAG: DsrE family protein [Candidatus Thiodiazotropha sp. (ex Monitilora ramsayi)]|nr:DsrE family protein [Candidatus Thiodiazotropha sp. (ex Monitilora ramsayi)]
MLKITVLILTLFFSTDAIAEQAKMVMPEYQPPKVVYDVFLDDPAKLDSALYWIRALMNPLTESPYDMVPESMDIKVVIHGTEIVALAKKNYEKYRDQVERMRYYDTLGVEFKVCGLAAHDFGYEVEDFQPFVDVVPSAFTELVHWQQQGYALIVPQVFIRTKSIEDIR